jgi:hypothetical protein
VFPIPAAIGVVPVRSDDPLVWLVLAPLGTVFTAVGGAFVFGRAWTTLDRAQLQARQDRLESDVEQPVRSHRVISRRS